jgi:TolB-like protein
MRKLFVLGLLLFCSVFVYAQETMVLDTAITDSVDFFSSKLPSGSTIAVTNFEAETKELSDFVIQELLVAFANTGTVRVVERSRMEILESELNFNMTGSVSDDTAQSIGRMIGAQIIFSGSIGQYRDMYRMRVQAIVVETAEVIGTRTVNIKYDPTLTGLLGRINPADQWKYQWLYAGINVGYTATFISPDFENPNNRYFYRGYYYFNIPFGFGMYVMVQPFDLFGIALDFGGTMYEGPGISVLPTLTLRSSSFEVDIFFGLGAIILPSSYGDFAVLGGVRGGLKVGPGVLLAEVRPIVTLGSEEYYAFFTNFTVGYQIGFIPRKK